MDLMPLVPNEYEPLICVGLVVLVLMIVMNLLRKDRN